MSILVFQMYKAKAFFRQREPLQHKLMCIINQDTCVCAFENGGICKIALKSL